MRERDFDNAVELYRQALGRIVNGDPAAVLELFSQRDDVTLANPFGPPRRGSAEVTGATSEAASHFAPGSGSIAFDEVARYATSELGYTVHIERSDVQFQGSKDTSPVSLRVTTIFRLEEEGWRIVHRHADPITTPRDITSIIEDR